MSLKKWQVNMAQNRGKIHVVFDEMKGMEIENDKVNVTKKNLK